MDLARCWCCGRIPNPKCKCDKITFFEFGDMRESNYCRVHKCWKPRPEKPLDTPVRQA